MEKKLCRKEFAKYVILNVLGMIGLSCYILADTFFVANGLGADGLTALNLAIPVYSLVHGSGLMFGVGGATRYSILRGQKRQKNADEMIEDLKKRINRMRQARVTQEIIEATAGCRTENGGG